MTYHYLNTPGARIRYRVEGPKEGEPLLLVQGLGLPGAMWLDLVDQVVESGFRVVVPDNRGTGGSEHRGKTPFTMKDLANDLDHVLEYEFGDSPALVVGISLGGMIAQHLVLRHPSRVKALLLACTTCGLPDNLLQGAFFTPQALGLLFKRCFFPDKISPDELGRLLTHKNSGGAAKEFFGEVVQAFEREGKTTSLTYLGQIFAALRHSTGAKLGQITIPTIVTTGDSDYLIPPKNTDILHQKIPNSRRVIVPEAGHLFPYEHKHVMREMIQELQQMSLEAQEG